jgi:hypothetical protein
LATSAARRTAASALGEPSVPTTIDRTGDLLSVAPRQHYAAEVEFCPVAVQAVGGRGDPLGSGWAANRRAGSARSGSPGHHRVEARLVARGGGHAVEGQGHVGPPRPAYAAPAEAQPGLRNGFRPRPGADAGGGASGRDPAGAGGRGASPRRGGSDWCPGPGDVLMLAVALGPVRTPVRRRFLV